MRLRKNAHCLPGTVYLDHQIFQEDIVVVPNFKLFIEPMGGEDPIKHDALMQVYVRRWRPSTLTVDKICEIVLEDDTIKHLKQQLSEFSGIPPSRVLFAKVGVVWVWS